METKTHIAVNSVSKSFRIGLLKEKWAVDDLSFSVPKGEVVGLLGPNGSGKSTTIKMMLGFLRPTRGNILICGHNSQETAARKFIGYLPENPRFQRFLTARQVLRYYGGLLSLSSKELEIRIDELLETVSLRLAGDERTAGFSKGMTQRLAIAQALLSHPNILIFDEPMSGLDPLGRIEIRKMIWDIHLQMPDTTIFFSSHVLSDVEELCTSVLLLRKGKLKRQCKLDELLENEIQHFEVVLERVPPSLQAQLDPSESVRKTSLGITVTVAGVDALVSQIQKFQLAGAKILGIFSQRKSLEKALFGQETISEGITNEAH